MYDKILAQLKQKFPGVPPKVIERIAKRIATKVNEETAIEGAITEFDNVVGVEEYANTIQSEGDRRVNEARKKPEGQQQQQKEEPAKDDDLLAMVKKLSEQVSNLSTQRQRDTLTETLHKKLTDKKIPLSMAKRVVLEKEEDVDAVFAEIETDYNALVQTNVDAKVKDNAITVVGGNQKQESIDADIAAWSKQNQPQQKEAAK